MSEHDKTISALNELISITKDGEKGFSNAASKAQRPDLKALFSSYALACAAGATELQNLVFEIGGEAKQEGSLGGALRRGLTDLKVAMTSHSDHAILEEVEKGEDVAKREYTKALQENLPTNVRQVIERQHAEVIAHHDKIRDLRDATV